MAAVQIAMLYAVAEKHAVALPIEAVSQNDLSQCAFWNLVQINGRRNSVARSQVELIVVGLGQCVGLPIRHGPYSA